MNDEEIKAGVRANLRELRTNRRMALERAAYIKILSAQLRQALDALDSSPTVFNFWSEESTRTIRAARRVKELSEDLSRACEAMDRYGIDSNATYSIGSGGQVRVRLGHGSVWLTAGFGSSSRECARIGEEAARRAQAEIERQLGDP